MKVLLLGLGNVPARFKLLSNHCDNFVERYMAGHEIITFGYNDGVDITITPEDDFQVVIDRLPPGWEPDFCMLWETEWNLLPPGVEHAPFPTVGFIYDWDYDLPLAKAIIEATDLVITPSTYDEEALRAMGARNVKAFHFAVVMEEFVDPAPGPIAGRKYDVLYTTWFNDSVQPERFRWISKLASLSEKYVVNIREPVDSYTDYIDLLRQSKLVICYHRFGALNCRAFEAAAQGAVPIDSGAEAGKFFIPDAEYVAVTEENLVGRIDRFLSDPHALERMSRRIYDKVANRYTSRKRFIELMEFIYGQVKGNGSAVAATRELNRMNEGDRLTRQGEIFYYSFFRTAPGDFFKKKGKEFFAHAVDLFERAARAEPSPRALLNLAVARTAYGFKYDDFRRTMDGELEVASLLRRIIAMEPSHAMAHYYMGILMVRTGNVESARDALLAARTALSRRENFDPWCVYSREFDPLDQCKAVNKHLIRLCAGEGASAAADLGNLYLAAVHYFLGEVEEIHGRPYEALTAMAEAYRLCPDSVPIATKLARLSAVLGYREQSVSAYEHVLSMTPMDVSRKIELMRIAYAYGMDTLVMRLLRESLNITKTFAHWAHFAPKLNQLSSSFYRYRAEKGYPYDLCHDSLLHSWTQELFVYLERNPTDIRTISRLAELLIELGKADTVVDILNAYIDARHNCMDGDSLDRVAGIADYVLRHARTGDAVLSAKLGKMARLKQALETSGRC